jgi:hypothetical protein
MPPEQCLIQLCLTVQSCRSLNIPALHWDKLLSLVGAIVRKLVVIMGSIETYLLDWCSLDWLTTLVPQIKLA